MAPYRSAPELRGVLCIRQTYLTASTTTPLVQGGQFREWRVVLHGQCSRFAGRLCAARKSDCVIQQAHQRMKIARGTLCCSSIPKHVLEADFWIASLRVCPGHNFRSARNSAGTIGSISFGLLLSGAKRLRSKVTGRCPFRGSARPVFSSDKFPGSAARRQQL